MNVLKSNRDRIRDNDSPNFAAEPVGIMPRNYSVFHLATAKRQLIASDNPPVSSNQISSLALWKLKQSESSISRPGELNMANPKLKTNSSSSAMPGTSGNTSSSTHILNAWNLSNSASNSKSSIKDLYPQLFQNIDKSSSSYKTPKKTPGKTSKSATGTSSRNTKSLRTTTSDSINKDSHSILAISEGRGQARGEIGISALDITCPHLILCQISDTQTYNNTLIKINVLNPVEIILPHTFCDGTKVSKLYSSIQDTFPTVTLTLIHRRHFNEVKGLQQIKHICANEHTSLEMLISQKFYSLCAAAALLKYVEYKHSKIFLPRSLNIEYQGPHNSTVIDVDSAHRLELTKSCTGTVSANSLLGILNRCRTSGGVRLLRANILEPPCSQEKIVYRLQSVQEMVQKPELLYSLQNTLSKVNHIDRLLALCIHIPQQDSLRAAEVQMNYILLLKTVLEQIPVLNIALENVESEFLCSVKQDLQNPQYSSIMNRILETIQEDAHIAKQYTAAHYQRCFAVKPGVNGLLDVARKTYSELIQDMIEVVQKIGENYGLPVTLKFSAIRGFHMQLILSNQRMLKENELPAEFIQVQKKKKSLTFTTQELIHSDERCNDVRNEIQIMSNVVVFKLLVDIRGNIGCLYKLCENIAYLDMLFSFAKLSVLPNFVQPKFGNVINIKCSRHPILDIINTVEPTANDIFCSRDFNFNIITGPNMSGKSIYIRQIVLLQIMAQIGCYVPAQEAMFRITDRIFTRLGFDDSIECNASTFVLEIREVQCILQTITPKSLVIMDELCRGTSNEEGTAVAWALCENLLQTKAFIFLTTHFMLLTKLEDVYTNVKNYHFEMVEQKDRICDLIYTHRLLLGPTKMEIYGIRLAEILGMPDSIINKAQELVQDSSVKTYSSIHVASDIDEDRQYLELVNMLLELVQSGPLTKQACLELKYKKFPHMTTNEELVAINEIIPCSYAIENDVNSTYRSDSASNSNSLEMLTEVDITENEEMNIMELDEITDNLNLTGNSEEVGGSPES